MRKIKDNIKNQPIKKNKKKRKQVDKFVKEIKKM